MNVVLVIFLLTVQSSYRNNIESDATEEAFDTVQFFATDKGAWRIKTYAMDQDVHVWSIASTSKDVVGLAERNTDAHYGDVLSKHYVITAADGIEGLRRSLKEHALPDHLEISEAGFLFWAPAGTSYRTRSRPQHEP